MATGHGKDLISPCLAGSHERRAGFGGMPVDPGVGDIECAVSHDEARAMTWCDAAQLTVEAQECRGVKARHAYRLNRAHLQHRARVANACGHVEMCPGEPSLVVDACITLHSDPPSLEA